MEVLYKLLHRKKFNTGYHYVRLNVKRQEEDQAFLYEREAETACEKGLCRVMVFWTLVWRTPGPSLFSKYVITLFPECSFLSHNGVAAHNIPSQQLISQPFGLAMISQNKLMHFCLQLVSQRCKRHVTRCNRKLQLAIYSKQIRSNRYRK